MSLLCSPHKMCATLFSNVFSVCKVNGPPPDASQLSPALKNIICFFENIFCFAIHHWIQGMHSEHRLFTKTQMWEWWFENEIERGLVCWSDVRRESYCAGREELAIVGESGQFVSQQSTTRMSAPPGCTNVCTTVPMCAPPGRRTPLQSGAEHKSPPSTLHHQHIHRRQ